MEIVQQGGVAVSEAVDTLLFITDDKIVVIIGKAFADQWPDVLPLTVGCILKFIDQIMLEPMIFAISALVSLSRIVEFSCRNLSRYAVRVESIPS